ncbi:MAG: hypothetical protein AMS14_08345 [Planctomycetes bacterium DG_20]|nr:MAG: hypothetical protein AMS14_08345 [Planctomycetes bacterium DG_20]
MADGPGPGGGFEFAPLARLFFEDQDRDVAQAAASARSTSPMPATACRIPSAEPASGRLLPVQMTASNAGVKRPGRFRKSATSNRAGEPSSRASARACSTMDAATSDPTASRPHRANRRTWCPVPQAQSSTRLAETLEKARWKNGASWPMRLSQLTMTS